MSHWHLDWSVLQDKRLRILMPTLHQLGPGTCVQMHVTCVSVIVHILLSALCIIGGSSDLASCHLSQ